MQRCDLCQDYTIEVVLAAVTFEFDGCDLKEPWEICPHCAARLRSLSEAAERADSERIATMYSAPRPPAFKGIVMPAGPEPQFQWPEEETP